MQHSKLTCSVCLQALYLLTTGAREAAFRNIKTIAECKPLLLLHFWPSNCFHLLIFCADANHLEQDDEPCPRKPAPGLADELVNAAKGSSNSYAIKKK